MNDMQPFRDRPFLVVITIITLALASFGIFLWVVFSILAGTRSPGYYRDTIDACVRAVKEASRRENNACNS
jgi:hypothetical protein